MIRKQISAEAAAERAEALCARAEYSQAEIMKKLTSWGVARGKAEEIVGALVDCGFIDDRRFALAFVNDKVELARWGRRKISAGLYMKGISRNIIDEAIDTIDRATYRRNIVELIKAKGRTIDDPGSYEGKTKILRFMMSRGFESATVIKLLNRPGLWDSED